MVRQARSEATRRKIIDSAVDLINEIGYPAAGLGDIIERAELTKGALYYHFDSKEALATAIIEEGSASVLGAFRAAGRTSSPAMENIIHGAFVVTDVLGTDRVAHAGARLLRTFGGFNPAAKTTFQTLLDELVGASRPRSPRAISAPTIDAEATGATIVGRDARRRTALERPGRRHRPSCPLRAELGVAASRDHLRDSLDYYREFLARQSLRAEPRPAVTPTH